MGFLKLLNFKCLLLPLTEVLCCGVGINCLVQTCITERYLVIALLATSRNYRIFPFHRWVKSCFKLTRLRRVPNIYGFIRKKRAACKIRNITT